MRADFQLNHINSIQFNSMKNWKKYMNLFSTQWIWLFLNTVWIEFNLLSIEMKFHSFSSVQFIAMITFTLWIKMLKIETNYLYWKCRIKGAKKKRYAHKINETYIKRNLNVSHLLPELKWNKSTNRGNSAKSIALNVGNNYIFRYINDQQT